MSQESHPLTFGSKRRRQSEETRVKGVGRVLRAPWAWLTILGAASANTEPDCQPNALRTAADVSRRYCSRLVWKGRLNVLSYFSYAVACSRLTARPYGQSRYRLCSIPAARPTPDVAEGSDAMTPIDQPHAIHPGQGSASLAPRPCGSTGFAVQPVPRSAARIVRAGLARDRLHLWSTYGQRYREAMEAVRQALRGSWDGASSVRNQRIGVVADLAAVRLYLTEEWAWLESRLLEGMVGDHLPLARCVASGLRRLPSYRGPAFAQASTLGMATAWYRENLVVVDQGFWSASASSAVLLDSEPGFLVWSVTGRCTEMVDPHARQRLVFAPGTRFKVLEVAEGRRPLVFMRELFPQEPVEQGPEDSRSRNIRWLDETTVAELKRAATEQSQRSAADVVGPCERLPGLIVTKDAGRRVY